MEVYITERPTFDLTKMDEAIFLKILVLKLIQSAEIKKTTVNQNEFILNFRGVGKHSFPPTHENYTLVKSMFELNDNNSQKVMIWCNKLILKKINLDLFALSEFKVKDTINIERMEDCKNSIIEHFIYMGLEYELIDFKIKDVENQSKYRRKSGRHKIENLLDIKKEFAKKVKDLQSRGSYLENALETAYNNLKDKYKLNWTLGTCRRYYYEVKNMI